MYSIPNAKKIADIPRIILGIMGGSGTGKTTAALTFPNPVVIDIDNNLIAHKKREDIQVLPFWDYDWIYSWNKYNKNEVPYPIRDAVPEWLKTEGRKLTSDQTLILDSWTSYQDAFDKQSAPEIEPVYTKGTTSINDFAFWDKKIDFSLEVILALKALKCHVVVTFHEQDKVTEVNTKLLMKTEPLMQGKFPKKLGLYFTDFFQAVVEDEMKDGKATGKSTYLWRTHSTPQVSCLKTRMFDCAPLIPAHYSSLKY